MIIKVVSGFHMARPENQIVEIKAVNHAELEPGCQKKGMAKSRDMRINL
jgi:hypothetical protein